MNAAGFADMIRVAARRDAYGDSGLLEGIAKYLAEVEEARHILFTAGLRHTGQPIVETCKEIVALVESRTDRKKEEPRQ